MAQITGSGGNGTLDVNALVSQLVAADRAPADKRLSTQQAKAQTRLTAFGSLKSALSTLQSSLARLKDDRLLQPMTASSSSTQLSASITPLPTTLLPSTVRATAGSYVVHVNQLAQTHKLASSAYADSSAVVGSGQLVISANGQSMTLDIAGDGSHDTLAGIRDAINQASDNPGVQATILTAQDGAHLVLTSTQSGAAGRITIQATPSGSDTGNLARLAFDGVTSNPDLAEQTQARDATLTVDGFSFTSASNSVTTAVPGVTLNLTAAAVGQDNTVTVSQDKAAAQQVVQDFVNAFNTLSSRVSQLTGYNAATKVAGDLQGDSTAIRLAGQIRQQLNSVINGADGNYDTLAEIGITSDAKTGALSVDSTKLGAMLGSSPTALGRFFSGSEGLATRITSALDVYTQVGGLIDTRTDGLKSALTSISKQQDAVNLRMEALTRRYTAQFNGLNTLLSQMTSTSNYLTGQLESLAANSK